MDDAGDDLAAAGPDARLVLERNTDVVVPHLREAEAEAEAARGARSWTDGWMGGPDPRPLPGWIPYARDDE